MMNRAIRRSCTSARKNNKYAWFHREISPSETGQYSDWLGEMTEAWNNKWFLVLVRTITTELGEVTHLCIRNLPSTDISWSDKMWIKDQIVGSDAYAVEVFPKRASLVDEANLYHLWVLPKPLPFGL